MNIQKNSIIRPTIYCYTTPNDKEHEGWCKIGYTDRNTADHCADIDIFLDKLANDPRYPFANKTQLEK